MNKYYVSIDDDEVGEIICSSREDAMAIADEQYPNWTHISK